MNHILSYAFVQLARAIVCQHEKHVLFLLLATLLLSSNSNSQECQGIAGMDASIVKEENARECQVEGRGAFQAFLVVNNGEELQRSDVFQINDRVILCIDIPFEAYVSVWDAPPQGSLERLFPNSISHPRHETAALVSAGHKSCIGDFGSGYRIEISANEGRGAGKFYLIVTQTLAEQVALEDFEIRGFGLSASIEKEESVPLEDLRGYADASITYDVK